RQSVSINLVDAFDVPALGGVEYEVELSRAHRRVGCVLAPLLNFLVRVQGADDTPPVRGKRLDLVADRPLPVGADQPPLADDWRLLLRLPLRHEGRQREAGHGRHAYRMIAFTYWAPAKNVVHRTTVLSAGSGATNCQAPASSALRPALWLSGNQKNSSFPSRSR